MEDGEEGKWPWSKDNVVCVSENASLVNIFVAFEISQCFFFLHRKDLIEIQIEKAANLLNRIDLKNRVPYSHTSNLEA